MADVLFDFDNPADAAKSLKRVAQAMLRAGQPVVSSEFNPKVLRTSGVSYHQALLTLASGQIVTLMVKLTGDVFRVLLNGAALPIHQQDGLKAVSEIAAAAEKNQAKFQAAQARKQVEIPKGIRSTAQTQAQAVQARSEQLDAEIADKTAQRDALKAELGTALDNAEPPPADKHAEHEAVLDAAGGYPRQESDGQWYARDQYEYKPLDEHGEIPGAMVLIDGAVPTEAPAAALDGIQQAALQPWLDEHEQALQVATGVGEGITMDAADVGASVATLQIALDVVENNAPINEAAGNVEQAALERANAESLRSAIGVLQALDSTGTGEPVANPTVEGQEGGSGAPAAGQEGLTFGND